MSTVADIVSAAGRLDPGEFVAELDCLEERLWDAELARTSAEMDRATLTDDEIDRMVLARRREGRA